jgi:hypothetical protein
MTRIVRTLLTVPLAVAAVVAMSPAALAVAPANDNFAMATTVGALPFTDSLSTVDATTQAGDPTECIGAAHSVWYSFTPASEVLVAFDTFGSDFDTVLSAYTGTAGAVTQIECNDDIGGSLESHIKWTAAAGTTYHVMVSGYGDSSGALELHAAVEAPFSVTVTVAHQGTVDEVEGTATVRATAVCAAPGYIQVEGGLLRQKIGTRVRGAISGFFDCGPQETTLEIGVRPFNGDFVRGKSRLVDAVWHGYSIDFAEDQTQSDEPTTVRLRR